MSQEFGVDGDELETELTEHNESSLQGSSQGTTDGVSGSKEGRNQTKFFNEDGNYVKMDVSADEDYFDSADEEGEIQSTRNESGTDEQQSSDNNVETDRSTYESEYMGAAVPVKRRCKTVKK